LAKARCSERLIHATSTGLGPIAQRLNEIAPVQRDRAGECLESLACQLQRRLRLVNPMIRGDLCSFERLDCHARVTTSKRSHAEIKV
jgi:hypothetical protein